MTSTSTVSTAQTAEPSEVLVEPGWLAEHLHDPAVRVVEVDVSPVTYSRGHIDGAVLWDIYRDLKDPEYRTVDLGALHQLVARSGIEEASTVVCYGYAPAMGFWVMKLLGHIDVRILNTSRQSWERAGLPWTEAVPGAARSDYPRRPSLDRIRADHELVRAAIGDAHWTVADVRTALEFRGERFWPSGGMDPQGRAGHVPTSINVTIEDIYDGDGVFRGKSNLRQVFASFDRSTVGEVITVCTIGGRACTAWFVLTYLLGREGVRVYDGSWAEWGRMTGTPVENTWPPTELADRSAVAHPGRRAR